MKIVKVNFKNPSLKIIELAAKVIKNGGMVVYPTDTIYGIGANALDKSAVKKIFSVKGREKTKPLSVAVSDIKMAKKYCLIGKTQEEIFKTLLPGPFTLIFQKTKKRKIFAGDKNTLAIRVPRSKITAMLSKKLGIPFTATSANLSGMAGNGDINKVLRQLKNKKDQIDLVLDAGVLPARNPSVIIDLTGKKPKILRK